MRSLRKYLGRRWRGPRLVGLVTVVVLGFFSAFEPLVGYGWLRSSPGSNPIAVLHERQRHALAVSDGPSEGEGDDETGSTDISRSAKEDNESEAKKPLFPEDLFTLEQRRHGAVFLHIMGMVYMFVALAIVCDEFFVPSLDVIIEKLGIVEDVAGATFMAAGGSAPELFTSIIGVFVSFDDVGIGTIVGSAVFNILFVIGMCSIFSHGVLQLTWWPLFRDVSFYSLSLIVLILCFLDSYIYWFEALLLLFIYTSYVFFMKWNISVEQLLKKHLYKNKVARVSSADQLVSGESHGRVSHTPVIHAGSKFRHGLLHLMISSIDPMHDGVVDEKATQNHAIASLKVLLDATKTPGANAAGTPTDSEYSKPTLSPQGHDGHMQAATALESGDSGQYSQETEMSHLSSSRNESGDETTANTGVVARTSIVRVGRRKSSLDLLAKRKASVDAVAQSNHLNHVVADGGAATTVIGVASADGAAADSIAEGKLEEEEGETEALDLSWPETTRKRISYVLLAPIMFPLWLTLPDTRRQEKKKWFAITFLGSIMWIAVYSYLMVWWASVAGESFGIPNEVMGLTFLAAGTSIPDLITSVIVARKGLGDMAVSSSIGSNIFDVTVGLPFPWLVYGLVHNGEPVPVSSKGMACSILVLFTMLIFVIMTIACCKWRMNKSMGIIMFLLYFVFVAVSLLFEYKKLVCPVD